MYHVAKITFENFISMPPCTMPGADIFNTGIFYLPYDGIDFFIRFVKQMKSANNTIHSFCRKCFCNFMNNIAYAASKHAVVGITKNFANELGKYNIQVNAIAPGYIAAGNSEAIIHDERIYNDFLSRIPAGRWGTPADLQGLAVFLSGAGSDYINGAIIPVDGGYLCR